MAPPRDVDHELRITNARNPLPTVKKLEFQARLPRSLVAFHLNALGVQRTRVECTDRSLESNAPRVPFSHVHGVL